MSRRARRRQVTREKETQHDVGSRSKRSSGSSEKSSVPAHSRRRRQGGGQMGKWVMRIGLILTAVIILSGFWMYSWVQKYLRSEEFRVFMGNTVGDVLGGDATFDMFKWQGMEASTGGLQVESDGFLQKMNARGIEARLNVGAIRRGVWEISGLKVKSLDVVLATEKKRQLSGATKAKKDASRAEDEKKSSSEEDSDKGFLSSLFPDETEVLSAEVTKMNLQLKTSTGDLFANELAMRVDQGSVSGTYDIHLVDGVIKGPWFGSVMDLVSAKVKYHHDTFYINDSRFKVYKRGQLSMTGEIKSGEFGLIATLKDVRAEELVPRGWRQSIMGDIKTRFKVKNDGAGAVVRGSIHLENGVLTALPMLDRIAAYANTRRFRRLNLSKASLNFVKEKNRLELSEIVMASEGLVRVEGRITIVDDRLDGRLRIGMIPGVLAYLPGAETKVFLRGDKGLLWAPLHITGTLQSPKEDLSERLIAAAGERMFEMVPETGKMALKFAHETATELPEKALETGTDVIRGGAGVIREGMQGVFDLLPDPDDE